MKVQWFSIPEKFNAVAKNPVVKRVGLLLAAMLFCGGFVASLAANPDLYKDIHWPFVVLLLCVAAPFVLLLNSLEILLLGRGLGVKLSVFQSMRVSVFSAAANIAPLPGGVIVRSAAFARGGAGIARSGGATVFAGFVWFGVALIFAGGWMAVKTVSSAPAFLLSGVFLLCVALLAAHRLRLPASSVTGIFLLRVLAVITEAAIYVCAFLALNVAPTLFQASVISVSGAIGSAVAVAPSGLGVREGAAAFLSVLVQLEASTGFIAAVLIRITTMAALFFAALFFTLSSKFSNDVPTNLTRV